MITIERKPILDGVIGELVEANEKNEERLKKLKEQRGYLEACILDLEIGIYEVDRVLKHLHNFDRNPS